MREKVLLYAILERAVLDIHSTIPNRQTANDSHVTQKQKTQAIDWLMSDEDDPKEKDGFSFIFVCRELGIEPNQVRKIVLFGELEDFQKRRGNSHKNLVEFFDDSHEPDQSEISDLDLTYFYSHKAG